MGGAELDVHAGRLGLDRVYGTVAGVDLKMR